jgi:hypothetical protein
LGFNFIKPTTIGKKETNVRVAECNMVKLENNIIATKNAEYGFEALSGNENFKYLNKTLTNQTNKIIPKIPYSTNHRDGSVWS